MNWFDYKIFNVFSCTFENKYKGFVINFYGFSINIFNTCLKDTDLCFKVRFELSIKTLGFSKSTRWILKVSFIQILNGEKLDYLL
jgi:hypothetical protein